MLLTLWSMSNRLSSFWGNGNFYPPKSLWGGGSVFFPLLSHSLPVYTHHDQDEIVNFLFLFQMTLFWTNFYPKNITIHPYKFNLPFAGLLHMQHAKYLNWIHTLMQMNVLHLFGAWKIASSGGLGNELRVGPVTPHPSTLPQGHYYSPWTLYFNFSLFCKG